MPAICYSSVQACAARFTRLDVCGTPQRTATGSAISDGFITINATHNYDEGETFEVKNACGERCIYERECPQLNDIDLSIDFCQVDPELFELVSGQAIVLDYNNEAVGFRLSDVENCTAYALEAWSKIPGQACAGGVDERYLYWLWPYVFRFQFGDVTLENGPVTFSFTGSTKANANWAQGPYDVVGQAGSAPGAIVPGPLLTAMTGDQHHHNQITEVPPPTPECGYVLVPAA